MEAYHKDTDEQDELRTKRSIRNESPWMTPQEAAIYLGIALGTLRNWTSARFVPFSKRGRTVRYHREKLDAWLASGSCPGRTRQ